MKKNLLIITPYLPWPLSSGGNVGVFYMLTYISKYVNVSLLTTYNKTNNYKVLGEVQKRLPNVRFELYDYRKQPYRQFEIVRKIEKQFDKRLEFGEKTSKYTINIPDLMTPGFLNFINAYLNNNNIDIVQVEFADFLPIVYALPGNIKKIFIHHELRFVKNELQYGKDVCDRFAQLFLKDCEISMCSRFDTVVALTEVDKAKLIQNGVATKIEVSTLAITDNTDKYRYHEFEGFLSFVGGSGHYPNYDGIMWFAEKVLPLVNRFLPNVKLNIIGSWGEKEKNEVLSINKNINFLGFVDNLIDGIRNTIMVVPINIGSGMRMKILEAANYSIPFVSTVVGAEGLNFHSGKDCFITSDAEEMAKKIVLLCNNKELFDTISKNVHASFEQYYSIESLGQKRLSLYD